MRRFAVPLAALLLTAPAVAQTAAPALPQLQPPPPQAQQPQAQQPQAQQPQAGQPQAGQDQGSGPLYYEQVLAPDAVRAVQGKLRDAGAFNGEVDGTWGADSEAALQGFQQTRGLQATGQMNQATVAVLGLNAAQLIAAGGAAAPASPPAPPLAPPSAPVAGDPSHAPVPMTTDAVRAVQARLRDAGFYVGAVDGVWGGGSQDALTRLQQARGLPVTGRIDAASVRALGFDPAAFP